MKHVNVVQASHGNTQDEINEALYGKKKRAGKYNASRTEVDGIWFASKREAAHYQNLKMLERSGIIRNLELQPRFPLIVNGVKVATYVADFRFTDIDGRDVIHDVKGTRTAMYVLKFKLFHACWPALRIVET